jgi:hypothetical protein
MGGAQSRDMVRASVRARSLSMATEDAKYGYGYTDIGIYTDTWTQAPTTSCLPPTSCILHLVSCILPESVSEASRKGSEHGYVVRRD